MQKVAQPEHRRATLSLAQQPRLALLVGNLRIYRHYSIPIKKRAPLAHILRERSAR
jgi:hypothetical protein